LDARFGIGQFFRIWRIQRVLLRHGVHELLLDTPWLQPMRLVLVLLPWHWPWGRERLPRALRLRNALEELGPLFVKFGQTLSTRRDLLPEDIANEFTRLQDRVPPFPGHIARALVEASLERPLTEVFESFDETPLASASIAQVHLARLRTGEEVVVKVVRPDIETTIRRDLGLLRTMAELAERYSEDGRRLKPVAVVAEFRRVILDELDLQREAANATQLRRNFAGEETIHVPAIHWHWTSSRVMVMERIRGIPINDLDALRAAGVDLARVAEMGVELFFTQVFRDRYFHADMHPGNIFVQPPTQSTPLRIAPVDFGIMGTLSEFDQRYLADNFLAFLERDYRRVAQLHVESEWVPAGTRVDEFEFAIRAVCEPMFERPMREISIGHLLLRLFQTAQRFHMHVLPQLVLLQKTLVNVEGVGRTLHPDLDIWKIAKPALERWIGERIGLRRLWRKAREEAPLWVERTPELPNLVFQALSRAADGKLDSTRQIQVLERLEGQLRRQHERMLFAVVGVGLVIAAALLLGQEGAPPAIMLGNAPLLAWLLGGAGGFSLMVAWYRRP
jgi:ubiquinone biosynthesis protein